MSTENTVDKAKLISELKEIYSELFQVYKKLFEFKYKNNETFKLFISNEYKENGTGREDEKAWNDNFCHRASYTLLNKILFVRICEDKGFMRNAEDYIAGEVKDPHIGEKLSKIGLQKRGRLITNYTLGELIKFAFNDMKQSYSNIVLYKEDKYEILNPKDEEFNLKYIDGDKDTKALVLEFENVLNNTIEKLDTSIFDFKHTDGNVLGDVYEKFMDRETRKAIGQFYTPEFVIQYILKNTVEEADIVANPFVTVADISCGSGHFLIMAYDILREKFLSNLITLKEKYAEETYIIKKDGREIQLTGRDYWVKENIHYHILKHCIYGADIDSFAVQLTTINLLLKDLDNFADELNIIECDSLIMWEERKEFVLKYKNLSNENEEKIIDREKARALMNLYYFWSKKFDYIVGNPPWISLIGKHRNKIREELQLYYTRKYRGNTYMPNMYEYFVRRGLSLINKNGKFSFVIPDRLGNNDQFIELRKDMIINNTIEKIIYDIDFPDVIADTMIFILSNKYNENYSIEIGSLEHTDTVKKSEILESKNCVFKSYDTIDIKNLVNKIRKDKKKLGDICDTTSGFGGNSKAITINKISDEQIKMLKGENIETYAVRNNYYFEFKKENITGRTTDINKLGFDKKILLRKTGNRLIATYDESRYYPEQSLYFIYNLNKQFNYYYILSIINSKLMNYYYLNELVTNLNSTPQLKKVDLDRIPVPFMEVEKQNYLVSLAQKISEVKRDILKWDFGLSAYSKNEILSSYNNYLYKIIEYYGLEEKIDNEIFSLYNLTSEEVEMIYNFFGIDAMEYKQKIDINKLYDSSKLYEIIFDYIKGKIYRMMKNNKYIHLVEAKETLICNIENFDELAKVLREFDPVKKSVDIIKEAINTDAYTWKAFRKDKAKDKLRKTFVKYYDSNYYGLTEWTDEIHKQYFMDAIDEYTVNSPSEKKAKDILKLFKKLDIEDYVDIIEDKIKKAFS